MSRYVRIVTISYPEKVVNHSADKRRAVWNHLKQVDDEIGQHRPDLAVFCEGVESKGQTVEQAEALNKPGELLLYYQQFAQKHHCTVAGSIKRYDDDNVYNSIAYVAPDGSVLGYYDKTFLTYAEIGKSMAPGSGAKVIDTPAGKLGGAICFDLNFTQLLDQYIALKPDIITFASMYHGGLMQAQWAYRTQSFFAAALPFIGGGILDPHGQPLDITDCYAPQFAVAKVNLDRVMVHLDLNRTKFPDIRKKYGQEVEINIPPNIGTALIYSHSDQRNAADIVQEFDLERRDDYFNRSAALNKNKKNKPA